MASRQPGALEASRTLLKILWALNLALAAICIAALAMSFILEPSVWQFYARRPPLDPAVVIPSLRVLLVLALPMAAAVHVLLGRLLAIVETVGTGDPFVPENAARMKTIAWCLLAIQVIGIGFEVMAEILQAGGADVDDWDLSLTGWVAVVLLFVLSRVFEEGARIRDDLEAMV